MNKEYKRPPRPGEGRPPKPESQKRRRRQIWIGEEAFAYVVEQSNRRGENMGEFVEHVLSLYKNTPQILE